jgi:transcriptional regulator with XRE-family HTH domain
MTSTYTTAKVLRDTRIRKEVSLTDLAKSVGISVQMACDVESGRKPLPDKYIDKWATAIGEDPDLVAIDIWQRRLNDFNRNRITRNKIQFKIVPILEK